VAELKPLKRGLESIVDGLLNLDDPAPIVPKPPAPVNNGVIHERKPEPQQKAPTMPAHGVKRRVVYRGPVVSKGSQIAPKRESSADYIDGRSMRATGRNSRLNLSLTEIHLNAFKWGANMDGRSYNEIFEAWIEQNYSQIYQDLLAAAKEGT